MKILLTILQVGVIYLTYVFKLDFDICSYVFIPFLVSFQGMSKNIHTLLL